MRQHASGARADRKCATPRPLATGPPPRPACRAQSPHHRPSPPPPRP